MIYHISNQHRSAKPYEYIILSTYINNRPSRFFRSFRNMMISLVGTGFSFQRRGWFFLVKKQDQQDRFDLRKLYNKNTLQVSDTYKLFLLQRRRARDRVQQLILFRRFTECWNREKGWSFHKGSSAHHLHLRVSTYIGLHLESEVATRNFDYVQKLAVYRKA